MIQYANIHGQELVDESSLENPHLEAQLMMNTPVNKIIR